MKKLILVAALGLSAVGNSALAATAAGTFNVTVTLTSQCQINSTDPAGNATITDISLPYTSFQTAASTNSTNFSVRCTTGEVMETMALDSASVTDAVTGIAYTLALSSSATHSVGPTVSLSNQTAAPGGTTYYVHANAAANQVGTAGTGTPTLRTLTITY